MDRVVNALSKPFSTSYRDRPVAVDELGRPVYQTPIGHQYAIGHDTPQKRQGFIASLLTRGGLSDRQKGGVGGYSDSGRSGAVDAIGDVLKGAWDGVTAPGRAAQGEPVTLGETLATAADWGVMGAPMRAPAGALRSGGAGGRKGITAYHGSPHDFDRFSMDKIGTGEGAQAYGHGLYFAENEGVARGYRDTLSQGRTGPVYTASRILQMHGGDEGKALEYISRNVDDAFERGDMGAAQTSQAIKAAILDGRAARMAPDGRMYEVRINADPDEFLDWDAPLSEQPEAVREAFRNVKPPQSLREQAARDVYGMENPWMYYEGDLAQKVDDAAISRMSGMEAYLSRYSNRRGKVDTDASSASNSLRDAGIPGIKYYDAGSRGAADGTRNYVVFDDNLIEIVRKYGIAGAAAMLGVSAQEVQRAMEENGS